MVAEKGLGNVAQLIAIVRDASDVRLPDVARQVLQVLSAQLEHIEAAIAALEKQLMAWHKANAVSQRLASIPGIGPLERGTLNAAIAVVASVKPQTELEALLAVQIVATGFAGLKFLQRGQSHLEEAYISVYGGYSTRLLRLQLDLIQALDKHRRGHKQTVEARHVHIHSGLLSRTSHSLAHTSVHAAAYARAVSRPCCIECARSSP